MKDIRKVIGLLLCMTISCYMMGEEKKNLNIVFIGNSITQGALLENPRHEAPPVKAALYLRRQPSVGTVRYSNQGVSGSTTLDFLPQTDLLFPKVVQVADQFKDETWATLIFSIMLGTNDSAITGPNGAPASPSNKRPDTARAPVRAAAFMNSLRELGIVCSFCYGLWNTLPLRQGWHPCSFEGMIGG